MTVTTKNHTLGTLQIPRGMTWADEFTWSAVSRNTERSITGALIVDEAGKLSGRPITLQGEESQGWIRRATLLSLQEMAGAAGQVYRLQLADGRSFDVQFSGDEPIAARPVGNPELPALANPYVATVRLITV
ncbi:hypothetical protein [Delftia acidovorans]|uniref:hypothetical protein n=1 Tax=Delftia acidovorans TaxID=80866 RepID=UPI001ED8D857|nr:hypothetical protein [Delftia acidovorans]